MLPFVAAKEELGCALVWGWKLGVSDTAVMTNSASFSQPLTVLTVLPLLYCSYIMGIPDGRKYNSPPMK